MKPTLKYGLLFLLLLAIEVFIAVYVHDTIVRPFVGDVLVVILIYCFMMFWFSLFQLKISKLWVSISVLLFAFSVEFAQAMDLLDALGLRNYKLARIVLGTSFDWWDLVAYFVGVIVIRISHT